MAKNKKKNRSGGPRTQAKPAAAAPNGPAGPAENTEPIDAGSAPQSANSRAVPVDADNVEQPSVEQAAVVEEPVGSSETVLESSVPETESNEAVPEPVAPESNEGREDVEPVQVAEEENVAADTTESKEDTEPVEAVETEDIVEPVAAPAQPQTQIDTVDMPSAVEASEAELVEDNKPTEVASADAAPKDHIEPASVEEEQVPLDEPASLIAEVVPEEVPVAVPETVREANVAPTAEPSLIEAEISEKAPVHEPKVDEHVADAATESKPAEPATHDDHDESGFFDELSDNKSKAPEDSKPAEDSFFDELVPENAAAEHAPEQAVTAKSDDTVEKAESQPTDADVDFFDEIDPADSNTAAEESTAPEESKAAPVETTEDDFFDKVDQAEPVVAAKPAASVKIEEDNFFEKAEPVEVSVPVVKTEEDDFFDKVEHEAPAPVAPSADVEEDDFFEKAEPVEESAPVVKTEEDDFFDKVEHEAPAPVAPSADVEDDFFDKVETTVAEESAPAVKNEEDDFFDKVEPKAPAAVATSAEDDFFDKVESVSAPVSEPAVASASVHDDFFDKADDHETAGDDTFFKDLDEAPSPLKNTTSETKASTTGSTPLNLTFDDDFLDDDEPDMPAAEHQTAANTQNSTLSFLEEDEELLSDDDEEIDFAAALSNTTTSEHKPLRPVHSMTAFHTDTSGFDLPAEIIPRRRVIRHAPSFTAEQGNSYAPVDQFAPPASNPLAPPPPASSRSVGATPSVTPRPSVFAATGAAAGSAAGSMYEPLVPPPVIPAAQTAPRQSPVNPYAPGTSSGPSQRKISNSSDRYTPTPVVGAPQNAPINAAPVSHSPYEPAAGSHLHTHNYAPPPPAVSNDATSHGSAHGSTHGGVPVPAVPPVKKAEYHRPHDPDPFGFPGLETKKPPRRPRAQPNPPPQHQHHEPPHQNASAPGYAPGPAPGPAPGHNPAYAPGPAPGFAPGPNPGYAPTPAAGPGYAPAPATGSGYAPAPPSGPSHTPTHAPVHGRPQHANQAIASPNRSQHAMPPAAHSNYPVAPAAKFELGPAEGSYAPADHTKSPQPHQPTAPNSISPHTTLPVRPARGPIRLDRSQHRESNLGPALNTHPETPEVADPYAEPEAHQDPESGDWNEFYPRGDTHGDFTPSVPEDVDPEAGFEGDFEEDPEAADLGYGSTENHASAVPPPSAIPHEAAPVHNHYAEPASISRPPSNNPYAPRPASKSERPVNNPYAPSNASSPRRPPSTQGVSRRSTYDYSPAPGSDGTEHHLSRPPSELAMNYNKVPSVSNIPSVLEHGSGHSSGHGSSDFHEERLRQQRPIFAWSNRSFISLLPPTIGYGAASVGTRIHIRDLKDLTLLGSEKLVTKYPGPLVSAKGPAKNKKKDLEKWMAEKIETNPTNIMLWSLLLILLKELPAEEESVAIRKLLNPDAVVDHKEPHLSSGADLYSRSKSAGGHTRQTSQQLRSVLDDLESGNRDIALQSALDSREWAHALVIAHSLGEKQLNATIREFVREELRVQETPAAEQLAFIYRVFGGAGGDAVEELTPLRKASLTTQFDSAGLDNNLRSWAKYVSLVIANRSPKDDETLLKLGKLLVSRDMVEAGHVCMILSGEAVFGAPEGIMLPGYNGSQSQDYDSIILSEIYEFVLLSRKSAANPFIHLIPFKATLGMILADAGYSNEASKNAESTLQLARTMKAMPLVELCELASQRANVAESTSTAHWITRKLSRPKLEKMWVSSFNKFVSGEDVSEEAEAPASHLRFATGDQPVHVTSRPASTDPNAMRASRDSVPRTSVTPGPYNDGYLNAAPGPSPYGGLTSLHSGSPSPAPNHMNDDHAGPYHPQESYPAGQPSYRPSYGQPEYGHPASNSHTPAAYTPDYDDHPAAPAAPQGYAPPAGGYAPAGNYAPVGNYAPAAANGGYGAPVPAPMPPAQHQPPVSHHSQEPSIEEEPEDLGFGNSKPKPKASDEDKEDDKADKSKGDEHSDTAKKGWFGWLRRTEDPNAVKPIKVKLGADKPSLYFDPDLKKWINTNASEDDQAAGGPPPPPKKTPSASPAAGLSPAPPAGLSAGPPSGPPGRSPGAPSPGIPSGPPSGIPSSNTSGAPTPAPAGGPGSVPASAPAPGPGPARSRGGDDLDSLLSSTPAPARGKRRPARNRYVDVMNPGTQ